MAQPETRSHPSAWIDEQAAEYADLVGSFVESVIDSDTEEMVEYQLIWEGGDLGVALTPMDGTTSGVQASRVTGKGFPFGIKNVGPGDILLSINVRDTTSMTLDEVVQLLQECDLPATLRFKKVSPDLDKECRPVSRRNTLTVTGEDCATVPEVREGSASRSDRSSEEMFPASPLEQHSSRLAMPYQDETGTTGADSSVFQESESPSTFSNKAVDLPTPPISSFEDERAEVGPPAPVAPLAVTSSVEESLNEKDEAVPTQSVAHVSLSDDEELKNDVVAGKDEKKQSPRVLRKDSSSVAMLGDYSTETTSIPIVDEAANINGITVIDNVLPVTNEHSDSDDENSPMGHAVQPIHVNSLDSRGSSILNGLVEGIGKAEAPRESVKVFTDSGRSMEPHMKSQPIGELHQLCAKGNLRGVVQYMRVNGSDSIIALEPNHGQSCLHLAVKSGNIQLVKAIIEQYTPLEELINLEDDKGNTALHFASTKTPGMVHLLLENGASANVKNSRKLTPLVISVITSKDDSVIIPRMLLKFGANPNDMHDGQTVIHTAIGVRLLQIAGALVKAGAKMDVEDSEGHNVFEKLDRRSTRFLISHIYFPPTYITEKERNQCMLCNKKLKFGNRKVNCTHCGRFCCHDCCSLGVEMIKFPMGFPGRIRRGAAVHDKKRVCKTCYNVFKERTEEPQKPKSRLLDRIIGIEWSEVNPNKLEQSRAPGRRGEKDYM